MSLSPELPLFTTSILSNNFLCIYIYIIMGDNVILQKYKEHYYPSADKLKKILEKDGVKVPVSNIKKVISTQEAYQLHHKPVKKIKAHMIAFHFNEKWIADLSDMSNFSSKNNGYKWILFVIDVFTRKLNAKKIKNKSSSSVLDAFKSIVNEWGIPLYLLSDNGSEFTNDLFQQYLESNNIYHSTVDPGYHKSLGIIDRVTRTIKEKIFKLWTDKNISNWVDHLDNVVSSYNKSPHVSLLSLSPFEASLKKNKDTVKQLNFDKKVDISSQHDFNVGDLVRVRLQRTIFTKGYTQIWSFGVYTIKKIEGQNAVLDDESVVKLNDLQKIPLTKNDINNQLNKPIPSPLPPSDNKSNSHFESNIVEKKAKQEKILKSLDMDKDNILSTKRTKKPNPKYIDE